MKSTYKRLGDLISPISIKNSDLRTTDLRGVNYQKYFMHSVANTVGVDLSAYKLVEKGQFACNLMHVGRDECLPIALHCEEQPIIVSPAYFTFQVKDENKILSEFLFLWFRRREFDRQACFYTDADVRQGLIKSAFLNMEIPVPSIEEQRKIVAEYQAIKQRIENNRRLIATLEATAQTIYRKMFVDDIDPENLPDGWRMGTIGEFCKETKSGGTPSRSNPKFWDNHQYRWLKSGEVANNVVFDTEEYISEDGLNGSSAKLIPEGVVVMAMYGATASQVAYLACSTTTNQACCNMITNSFEESAYLYYHCLTYQKEIKRLANGGAQENLSQDLICAQPIIIAGTKSTYEPLSKFLKTKISYSSEIVKLEGLLSLYLSKLFNL